MVWYFGNVLLYFSHNHKVTTRGDSASKKWQLSWIDHLSWIKFYWLLWYLCWAEWKSQKLMGSSAPYHDFMLFYNQLCWEHFPCKRPLQDINNEKSPDTPQCRYHDAGNGGENYSSNEYKPYMDGLMDIERCGFESRMWEVLPCEDYLQDYPPKPRSDHDHFHHNVVLFVSVNIAAESSFYANDPCGLGVCLADGTSNVFLNARYKFGRHPSQYDSPKLSCSCIMPSMVDYHQ